MALYATGCSSQPQFDTIRTGSRLTLYEGLPHGMYEEDLLKGELKSKQTIQLHDFAFYRESLEVKRDDATKLSALIGDNAAFKDVSGLPKPCGGFHPDFAIEWSSGGRVYHCLICFGCDEAKLYGRHSERYCDIAADARKGIREILKSYRKNRPESEHFKFIFEKDD